MTLIPNHAASSISSKDLSCLRCRKKKAKCSKTRPTCTRCARSNQSCEYPDAPPNLTNLSAQVLHLYDTLRELEGEFLEKCLNQNPEDADDRSPQSSPRQAPPESPLQSIEPEVQSEPRTSPLPSKSADGLLWSLSFTSSGLSLQTTARTLSDYDDLTRKLSRQLYHDTGPHHLPEGWDMDTMKDEDASSLGSEDLDEAAYLVAIPIVSFATLFIKPLKGKPKSPLLLLSKEDTVDLTPLDTMRNHIEQFQGQTTLEYDVMQTVQLVRTLQPHMKDGDPLTHLCICTGYVALARYLSLPIDAAIPSTSWLTYATYATTLLIDMAFSLTDNALARPLGTCALLLAWIDMDLADGQRSRSLMHLAQRLLHLCNLPCEPIDHAPIFLYLKLSSIFLFTQPSIDTWQHLRRPPSTGSLRCNESQVLWLLHRALFLFYCDHSEDPDPACRVLGDLKVDIDDVLTLVRDLDMWEHHLPLELQWVPDNMLLQPLFLHLVHNLAKILLFRPFCMGGRDTQDASFTTSSFLDQSLVAADRLSTCVNGLRQGPTTTLGAWLGVATHLIADVCTRTQDIFSGDDDVLALLKKLQPSQQRFITD